MERLTQKQLNNSKKLSLISAGSFSIWFLTCTPQPLYNIFIANYLTDSPATLGILVSALYITSVFQIFSVFITRVVSNQKWLWITTSIIQRLLTLVLAIVAFMAKNAALRDELYAILLVSLTLGWIIAQLGNSCWWSWMARIIPEKQQGSFFANRSYISAIVNAIWFLSTSFILDVYKDERVYTVYGIIFLIGGIAGLLTSVLHIFIPDINVKKPASPYPLKGITSCLRDRNYLTFLAGIFCLMMAINIVSPFIAPYLTSTAYLNIPKKWIGIQFGVRQILWIITMPLWGISMDRFGKKPVVLAGTFFFLSWFAYLFINHNNYYLILIITGIINGVFGPPLLDGIAPFMLSIAPHDKKLEYSSLFWGTFGVSTALGSLLGGVLFSFTQKHSLSLFNIQIEGLSILILTSLFFLAFAIFFLFAIKEKKSKSVAYLFSRISNPGAFRTYMNIGTMRKPSSSEKVAKTLRALENAYTSEIVIEDVIERLNDPDPIVREEAIRVLGRTQAQQAVSLLLSEARNKESFLRVDAIKSLGKIGDTRACEDLQRMAATKSEYPSLRIASLHALADIGCQKSLVIIISVLTHTNNQRIRTSAAIAGTKLHNYTAARELILLLQDKKHQPNINEIGTHLGGLIGPYKSFYALLAGNLEQRTEHVHRLVNLVKRNILLWIGKSKETTDKKKAYQKPYDSLIKTIFTALESSNHPSLFTSSCHLYHACKKLSAFQTKSQAIITTTRFIQWVIKTVPEKPYASDYSLFVLALLVLYTLKTIQE